LRQSAHITDANLPLFGHVSPKEIRCPGIYGLASLGIGNIGKHQNSQQNELPFKTKSIYADREASDGVRVLVSRYYPRGVKRERFDLWMRDASPEIPLLKEYKSGKIDWTEFSKRYKSQMRTNLESKRAIKDLIELSKENGSVTLLCYEKEGENCHRFLLKQLVDSTAKRQKKNESQ
jgi:uncharacterized protein YeaO (DUF488 family)